MGGWEGGFLTTPLALIVHSVVSSAARFRCIDHQTDRQTRQTGREIDPCIITNKQIHLVGNERRQKGWGEAGGEGGEPNVKTNTIASPVSRDDALRTKRGSLTRNIYLPTYFCNKNVKHL